MPTPEPTPTPTSALDRVVRGTQKNDSLTGTPESGELVNYSFFGLDGNDRISGGNGDDRIFGGGGRNIEIGGDGNDLFGLSRRGTAIVRDFEDGIDQLGLLKPLSFGKLDIQDKGKDSLIKAGNQLIAVLKGVDADQLSAADFKKL
jgi:Ca2+-binding RTX toxin-like protein